MSYDFTVTVNNDGTYYVDGELVKDLTDYLADITQKNERLSVLADVHKALCKGCGSVAFEHLCIVTDPDDLTEVQIKDAERVLEYFADFKIKPQQARNILVGADRKVNE